MQLLYYSTPYRQNNQSFGTQCYTSLKKKGILHINLKRPLQSTKSFILQIQGHKYLLTNLTEINLPRLAAGVGGDVPLIAGGGAVGAKEETVDE